MNILTYKTNTHFEKNMGQFTREVKYKTKAKDYIVFFLEDKLVISLPSNIKNMRNVFYMKLENQNKEIEIKGEDKQRGILNYIIGNDESKWINGVPTYSRIKYENVYEYIDLYYYINNDNLEYDFVLSNKANPKEIYISFEGIDNLKINQNDEIVLTIGDVNAILLKPEVYQIIDNERKNINCKYVLDENKFVSFLLEEYEKEYELVLDPVLKFDYSTYIGGSKCDFARGIAVDNSGCAYITGYTEGDYPVKTGQITYGGGSVDAFITKLSADGSSLVYSTYLGGGDADYGNDIAIDDLGNAYVTGQTSSSDFPIIDGSYQTMYGANEDVFVTKLDYTGGLLVYSTYIGGIRHECANSIAVDNEGSAYITGIAEDSYPTTTGAYQRTFAGSKDVFVTKLDKNGKELIYSTYIGGSNDECGNAVAVDSEGYAYITGYAGANYPTTKGAYQRNYGGNSKDVFVSKLDKDGSKLIYSTYLGGSAIDIGNAITVDDKGYAYVVGYTEGTFPMFNPYQSIYGGNRDIFISKLSIEGSSLIYSTYIGGNSIEDAYGVAVDNQGYAYITGYSDGDVLFRKVSEDGSKLISNTSLHNGNNDYGMAITLDNKGVVYIAGFAESGYQTTTGAYQSVCGGNHDVIVSKLLSIDFDISLNYTPTKVKLLDVINTKLVFENLSQINIDVNIKYQPLDSSIAFIQNSLYIQGVNQPSNEIPQEIYLSNIPPQQTGVIELDLKYIKENLSIQIPITVITEIYDNKSETPLLLDSRTTIFYIETVVGVNYIPGCNNNLYNLAIKDEIQTTSSGIPIIYYKSGTSYIYREPSENSYVYKELSNSSGISEIPIKYL